MSSFWEKVWVGKPIFEGRSLILNCRNFLVEHIEMWWQRSFINCDFFALVGITLFYLNYALASADLWLRHTCCLEMIDFCVWCVMLSCGERWAGDMQQMTSAGKGEVRHRRLRSWRQVYRGMYVKSDRSKHRRQHCSSGDTPTQHSSEHLSISTRHFVWNISTLVHLSFMQYHAMGQFDNLLKCAESVLRTPSIPKDYFWLNLTWENMRSTSKIIFDG